MTRPSPGTFGSLALRVSPYATKENLVTPAEAVSSGRRVAGGSIARTVTDAGATTGGRDVCNARTLAGPKMTPAITGIDSQRLRFTARIIASGVDGSVKITVHV